LKEEDGYDPWVIQDAEGKFYLWDECDGGLYRVTENWTSGLDTIEDIVDTITNNLPWVRDDAVQVFTE
jgi:hypothetical protein